MEEAINLFIKRYEEIVREKACLQRKYEKTIDKNDDMAVKMAELSRTITVLQRTCKAHNDFIDECGYRNDFQKYFDNVWLNREENK